MIWFLLYLVVALIYLGFNMEYERKLPLEGAVALAIFWPVFVPIDLGVTLGKLARRLDK